MQFRYLHVRCYFYWIFMLAVLAVKTCGDNILELHSINYIRGNYSVDNTLIVNRRAEYILSFPNTSTSNPYRVSAYCDDATFRFPVLIVVRQEKQVLSWQIPMIVTSSLGFIPFRNTSRTLCYSSREIRQQKLQDSSVTGRNFSVSVSTSSEFPLPVTIRADEVTEFFIEDDVQYTTTISPSEPVFYFYTFPEGEAFSRAFIEIDSEDEVCLLVSVQDGLCPVRDLNQDIKFEGKYQTVNLKGAFIVTKRRFPFGFFLVFVAMGDNIECNQESSILPIPRSRVRATTTFNRTSHVSFSLRQGITEDQYLMAILVVFLANVAFCIIFISIIAIFYYCRKKKDEFQEDEDDEDVVDNALTTENDIIDHYLERNELTVQDFCARTSRMQKKSFNYFWHITNIAIFYGIPVVQLMVAYQRMVNLTGDLDTCYHNFMCAHPLAEVNDFNHIYSNIGYMMLGILFLCVTLFRQQKHKVIPNCGIPRHYGLFYAMGVALIVEGILSACYHVCPNQSNYQFDTSFMYVMAVLCMIKLYQNRHPRINASAYSTFTILGIAVFMAMLGILTNSTIVMITFVVSYLILCTVLSFKIYFFGYVLAGILHFIDIVKHRTNLKSAMAPIRKGRFVLLVLANLCNLTMAIVGIIFYPSYTDFGTYLLAILMANAVVHAAFYVSMKLYHKERVCIEACIYGFCAILTWGGSAYFFMNGSTLWTVTPAQSRQLNQECIFMSFYDQHDIWHLMSAPGMFFIFMLLMHLDDDLAQVPRNEIIAF